VSDPEVRQFVVDAEDDGIRLDRWFKRHLPEASFNVVSRWARTGQLRVDGSRATPGDRIETGQTIRVPPAEPAATAPRPKRARSSLSDDQTAFAQSLVIHCDAATLVIDKPPGLATQGGTGTTEHVDGLLDALAFDAPMRPKLVHRLDKDTSGVLLVARGPRAAAFFAKSFSSRTARKTYWAIVTGNPAIDEGVIELAIDKQPGTGGEKMHVVEGGLTAKTGYRVIDRAGDRAAFVELRPFTGRTHQLRVHMAAIGHPILGDRKYGGPEAFLTGAISRKMHLHARRLRIDHPDGGKLDITAELPEHFAATMASLGFEAADAEIETRPPRAAPAELKKRAAKAHAKDFRKARRGERRKRGQA